MLQNATESPVRSCPGRRSPWLQSRAFWAAALLIVTVLLAAFVVGCGSKQDDGGTTTSSGKSSDIPSGDIAGKVGTTLSVGDVRITVSLLEESFQPTVPVQRLSDSTPVVPSNGRSLYQAYVRVENRGTTPVRVDPSDLACKIGTTISVIEPTRSGPLARSLLKNASLDLIVTFIGYSGRQPVLLYMPSWYNGTITFKVVAPTTTTTQ